MGSIIGIAMNIKIAIMKAIIDNVFNLCTAVIVKL